ncbi:uncharacterized protein LOC122378457 [Amphibalanus amphitrite]|nr:uncharacterized protein LOC122378457 [Amphibalanus amphitrite]
MERAAQFMLRTRSDGGPAPGDIRNIVNRGRRIEIEANRKALLPIIDIVLTCGRQNIALRGHRDDGRITESEPPDNDGNFRSLVRLLVRHGDGILKEHLEKSGSNATYISKTTQNQILDCAMSIIRSHVRENIQGRFISVLADETTDRAGREQMVVVFRYATEKEGKWVVREDPVAVVDLVEEIKRTGKVSEEEEVKMSGENIGNVLTEKIKEFTGAGSATIVGCGFDGAAAMASENVGVAAVMKRDNPYCDYYHCAMHSLNLCVSACCKQPDIRGCIATIKELTSFFNMSAKRIDALRRAVKTAAPERSRTRLVSLCATRFLERHDAILTLCEMLPSVVTALEDMETWYSPDTRNKAGQLRRALSSASFLVALFALESITAIMLPVARALQAKQMDAVTALEAVQACTKVLQSWREQPDERFAEVMTKAEQAAESLGVVIKPPRCASKSVYRANAGDSDDPIGYYRVNCFLPLLSSTLQQLEQRFGERQQTSFKLRDLLPAYMKPWEEVESALLRYSDFLDPPQVVKAEHELWRTMWTNKPALDRPRSAVEALDACSHELMPNICKLLEILAALPVTTAEPERFFSRVSLAASSIRATMTEDRLEAICMLQVYRQCPAVTSDAVLEVFSKTQRKKNFVL